MSEPSGDQAGVMFVLLLFVIRRRCPEVRSIV